MSKITLAIEHPSLGYGEIIASYDLSEIQEKAYQQGRAEAVDKCITIVSNNNCILEDYCNQQCVECICRRLKELKESQNES